MFLDMLITKGGFNVFKKLLSSAIVIAMVSCFAIPSFAMYGSVIANSQMDDDGTLSTHVIYGAGSAEEVLQTEMML